MYDRATRFRGATPVDHTATGAGDSGTFAYTAPPGEREEESKRDMDTDEDDGYIPLHTPPGSRQWHELTYAEAEELAKRARTFHAARDNSDPPPAAAAAAAAPPPRTAGLSR